MSLGILRYETVHGTAAYCLCGEWDGIARTMSALEMIAALAAWALALAVAIPLAIFALEVAVGLPGSRRAVTAAGARRVCVLIPAHDEAAGIAGTLAALKEVAGPEVSVLVVADNCSDNTAAIARAGGAEAIERADPVARGKGYALAFGRDHLARSDTRPEIVIVLDADCRLAPGSVAALVVAAGERPAQAINLIAPDLAASAMTQISGFAMVVKNLFRSRGMTRLGGAALLTGTGMAFPWPLFATAQLASGALAEDLDLGIALARAGHPARLVEDASVSSAPAPPEVALQQRTRWEHGFLDTVRRSAFPLLWSGLRRGSAAEFLLGCHLMVPPLALLLMLASAVLAAITALGWLGARYAPALVVAALLAAALSVTFLAWLRGGRRWLRGTALLKAPLYILWKLPVYAGFLRKRETEWRRTPRAKP